MHWHWWIEPQHGMPLLIAMIASFTSVAITLVAQIFNSRSTRRVMQDQLRAQNESRWSETKYETFTRMVQQIDLCMDFLNALHNYYMGLKLKLPYAKKPTLSEEGRQAFGKIESFTGEMQLLAPETRIQMRQLALTVTGALGRSIHEDPDTLVKAIIEAQREYAKLLNLMRDELGLQNGRATYGMVLRTPKETRRARIGKRISRVRSKLSNKA